MCPKVLKLPSSVFNIFWRINLLCKCTDNLHCNIYVLCRFARWWWLQLPWGTDERSSELFGTFCNWAHLYTPFPSSRVCPLIHPSSLPLHITRLPNLMACWWFTYHFASLTECRPCLPPRPQFNSGWMSSQLLLLLLICQLTTDNDRLLGVSQCHKLATGNTD